MVLTATMPLARTQRNYRTFLLFVYSTSIFIMWTFAICLWSLFVKHDELEEQAQVRTCNT